MHTIVRELQPTAAVSPRAFSDGYELAIANLRNAAQRLIRCPLDALHPLPVEIDSVAVLMSLGVEPTHIVGMVDRVPVDQNFIDLCIYMFTANAISQLISEVSCS